MLGWIYWDLVEPPELKRSRHYNMLLWPQNAGNPISEDQSLKQFSDEDSLDTPKREPPLAVCILSTLLYNLMYLPQRFTATWNPSALYSTRTNKQTNKQANVYDFIYASIL